MRGFAPSVSRSSGATGIARAGQAKKARATTTARATNAHHGAPISAANGGPAATLAANSPNFTHELAATRSGGGTPLPEPSRTLMEPRFGEGFGNVRVHADDRANSLASSIQARAFTLGPDVFFARGAFQPSTESGQRLLAHELTHVQQQRVGQPTIRRQVADDSPQAASGSCSRTGPERTEWLGNPTLEVVRSSDGGALLSKSRGSGGSGVQLVQEALRKWGCTEFRTELLPRFGADGDFGGETEAAVRHFQMNERLESDGVVGPATLSKLDKVVTGATAKEPSAVRESAPSDRRPLFDTGSSKSTQPSGADLGAKTGPRKGEVAALRDIQATSWVDPFTPRATADQGGFAFVPGMIGQIFFETGSNSLSLDDTAELKKIGSAYPPVLNQQPPPVLAFAYVGFTDVRRFRAEGGNLGLAKRRGESVLGFVDQTFQTVGTRENVNKAFPNYKPSVIAIGPDPSPKNVGTDAAALRFFRRVDIFAPIAQLEPPPRNREPGPTPKAQDFTVQMIVGGGGGAPETPKPRTKGKFTPKVGLGFEVFLLRIRDTKNKRGAEFQFTGFTVGFGLPISAGSESEVKTVKTTVPITLEQFEGFASHAGLQAEAGGVGPSVDEFIFFGPQIHVGAEPVVVRFTESAGTGAGGGVTPGIPFTPLATGALELASRVRKF